MRLTWVSVRRRTSTNPAPGNCQLQGRQGGKGTGAPLYPWRTSGGMRVLSVFVALIYVPVVFYWALTDFVHRG